MSERERFEAALSKLFPLAGCETGDDDFAAAAWLVWQAARALPPEPAPSDPAAGQDARDAARYRWLCSNSFDRPGCAQIHAWLHTWEPHSQTGEPTEWVQRIRGGALDRVIDEQIAAELPEPPPAAPGQAEGRGTDEQGEAQR